MSVKGVREEELGRGLYSYFPDQGNWEIRGAALALGLREKARGCLLGPRLDCKLWEAVFYRPRDCKNKWCLYKDLGSEKTVIKQELRSLSSRLLSIYRRQKPSKLLLLGPWEFCPWLRQPRLNGGMLRCLRMCMCAHMHRVHRYIYPCTEACRVASQCGFIALGTDSHVFRVPWQVTPRKKFKCPECTAIDGLSLDQTHMVER